MEEEVSMTDTYFELYRAPSPTGSGTKDWAIKVTGQSELTVLYGTTGRTLRTRVLKLAPGETPQSAKASRIQEKVSEGYNLVGQFELDNKGKAINVQDIERRTWSLSEVDSAVLETALRDLTEELAEHSFETFPVAADYDANLEGAIFNCDGFLPEEGWTLAKDQGLTFQSNRKVMGGGKIDHNLQLVLLVALAAKLPAGMITAVSTKQGEDRNLMPEKRGLPSSFMESLSLSTEFVREVGQVTGIVAKPIPILSEAAENTSSAFCF